MGFNAVLLGSFLVVILAQAVNRTAGAVAAIVWCLGLSGYGFWMFETGADISLLGKKIELWHFVVFMSGALAYNGWVLYRQLRRRR